MKAIWGSLATKTFNNPSQRVSSTPPTPREKSREAVTILRTPFPFSARLLYSP
jgi:hypothetical protein